MRPLQRAFWMITDQTVFAISNFIMNVLFARWLSAIDYGIFAVSFSAYLFLTLIHWGAFLEPLLVLSPQVGSSCRRSYIMTLGLAHALLISISVVISLAGLLVAWSCHATETGLAIVGAGAGGSLLLTLITARRLCLVFLTPRVSAIVGLVYLSGVLITGSTLPRVELSWFSLWEIMGIWSLICSLIIFVLLFRRTSGSAPFPLHRLVQFQRRYASRAIPSSLCQWASFDGVYIMLSGMIGLSAVAETKAIFNIASPLGQVNIAMHALSLVLFSEKPDDNHDMIRLAWLYAIIIGLSIIILYFSSEMLALWLYGGHYVDVAWELPIYVATIGLTGLSAMITSLFKAQGGLWQGFTPLIVDAVVAISIGAVAIPQIGQPGAIYAIFAGGAASLVTAWLLLRFAYPKSRSLFPV